jgi:hypothetical protein
MNDESSSKRTFKITLTCQSAPLSIYHRGDQKITTKVEYPTLHELLLVMHRVYAASHVTQMEVEEVNPSPQSPTKKPSSTKEQSLKKSTSVSGPGTEGVAESNWGSDWVDDGV